MTGHIYVAPIHHPLTVNLQFLADALADRFGTPCRLLDKRIDPDDAYDRYRNQYHSTKLLAQLLEACPEDGLKILGVTTVDLFIPILTYVFGEAQLEGRAAVVSCYRLKNELYGIPPNNRALQSRLLKEAVHELGHTFGMIHCEEPNCVMRVSTYVEEIDFKPVDFCTRCAPELERAIRSARLQMAMRYRKAST